MENEGARFENMVAGHLLKYCHFMEDTTGDEMDLRFIRDTDGREVDFVVSKNQKPLLSVEYTLSDSQITRHMLYFGERLSIPRWVVVHKNKEHFTHVNLQYESMPVEVFLKELI